MDIMLIHQKKKEGDSEANDLEFFMEDGAYVIRALSQVTAAGEPRRQPTTRLEHVLRETFFSKWKLKQHSRQRVKPDISLSGLYCDQLSKKTRNSWSHLLDFRRSPRGDSHILLWSAARPSKRTELDNLTIEPVLDPWLPTNFDPPSETRIEARVADTPWRNSAPPYDSLSRRFQPSPRTSISRTR